MDTINTKSDDQSNTTLTTKPSVPSIFISEPPSAFSTTLFKRRRPLSTSPAASFLDHKRSRFDASIPNAPTPPNSPRNLSLALGPGALHRLYNLPATPFQSLPSPPVTVVTTEGGVFDLEGDTIKQEVLKHDEDEIVDVVATPSGNGMDSDSLSKILSDDDECRSDDDMNEDDSSSSGKEGRSRKKGIKIERSPMIGETIVDGIKRYECIIADCDKVYKNANGLKVSLKLFCGLLCFGLLF